MLEIRLLGQFEVRIDGKPVKLPSRQAQALLAYLLLNRGLEHRREKLAGLLWPDTDPASGRDKLRYALWRLRKTLGEEYFQVDRLTIAFDTGSEHWLDVAILTAKTDERITTDSLIQAVSLYRGELLPGFYEDWVILEAERLQAAYELKIQLLLRQLMEENRWREAIEWSEHWISSGKTPEPAFRSLIVAHAQLGDVSGAVNAYRRCENTLIEQLGVGPSEETRELFEQVESGRKPIVPAAGRSQQTRLTPPVAPTTPPFLLTRTGSPKLKQAPFVARESDLRKLTNFIEGTIVGQGRVVTLVGEAGRGKTTLLREFSRREQETYPDLVTVFGNGEAHFGSGDPHLPFRDILALLTGDLETKWSKGVISSENATRLWNLLPLAAEALVEQGPDLIDSFVAREALQERISTFASNDMAWSERMKRFLETRRERPVPLNVDHGNFQRDLFEQYTRFLQRLAQHQPLFLILDDLQWADLGSISLLSHLGRRIVGDRILIVGAYRPDELTKDRHREPHPLAQVVSELKRSYGEVEINLDQSDVTGGREFIDALLDTEPNHLDENFRTTLHHHTGGHPLFTVELLRQMETQGDLTKDESDRWIVNKGFVWDQLPARVEAVIASRVNRLPPHLRDILNAASVEGEEFTAEVLAMASKTTTGELVRVLSGELDKQYLLVEAEGIQRVGDQRYSVYRFRHHLFQKYVYDNLDEIERAYLHEVVGRSLETLYHERLDEAAVRLARHYELAGTTDKAVDYLLRAGNQAKLQSANEEAIGLFSRGLRLLNDRPESPERDQKELALQIAVGAPLVAIQGYTAPEVEQTYERARELCEQIGEASQLPSALWGVWSFCLVRANFSLANDTAEQLIGLANTSNDPHLHLVAHWTSGITMLFLGEFQSAREHLSRAVEIYFAERYSRLAYLYGQDPGMTCLIYLAITLWCLGYPDQAREKIGQAVRLADEIAQPFSQSFAFSMSAILCLLLRDTQGALDQAQRTIDIARPADFAYLLAISMVVRSWARVETGKRSGAARLMKNTIEAMHGIGAELGRPLFLSLLAEAYGKSGKIKEGLEVIETALEVALRNRELWYEPALYRIKGQLLEQDGGKPAAIETCYQESIQSARLRGTKSMELRSTLQAAVYAAGREQEAKTLDELGKIYNWFSEGFDTVDLREAAELLESKGPGR